MSSPQPGAGIATEAPSPPAHAPATVLRILSGLHAGATRTLAEQEMILVGSGDDCDIVLADHGVARHHALINLVGGMSSLRALDAPLRIDGHPLHPGDPVELRGLQRIQLGDAAIAFGGEDDPRWATLLPEGAPLPAGAKAGTGGGMRKLPLVAALAVLSLASLAIFAAVMPQHVEPVDPRAQLQALIGEFQIGEGRLLERGDGTLVLSGTVRDGATRDSIEARVGQIRQLGVEAALDLRSGDKIAADVSEVLRTQGLNAQTRYLGNGVVEVSGRFEDVDALGKAAQSRAMNDVPGVTRVYVKNYVPEEEVARTARARAAAAPAEPTRIVKVVRGEHPHLVAVDGTEYPVGSSVPGLGQLVLIGEHAQVIGADGISHKVVPRPVTAEELAAAAEQEAAKSAGAGETVAQDDAAAGDGKNQRVARAQADRQDSTKKNRQ